MLFYITIAFAHQCPDRGRRGIEYVYFMLGDHLPETIMIGVVGNALKHQRRRAVLQGAIDDIAMSRDPANVGGAPEYFACTVIKRVMKCGGGPNRIAARAVQHAFGLARRSRCVQDE